MAGRTEPGIDYDRNGRLLDNYPDLITGLDAAIGADGRAERHDGGHADVLQTFGQNRVGIDVRQHGEFFANEHFGCAKGFDRIGQQVTRVRMDFELDPFGQTGGGSKSGQAEGFFGVHRAAGIGQKEVAIRIDEFEDVGERVFLSGEISATKGDGNDLSAASSEGFAHRFGRGELAGADEESRLELASGNGQRSVFKHLSHRLGVAPKRKKAKV